MLRAFAATIRDSGIQIPEPQIWYDLDDGSTLTMTGTRVDQINSKGTIANMEMLRTEGTSGDNELVDYNGRKVVFSNSGSQFIATNSEKLDYTFLHDRLLNNSVFVVFNTVTNTNVNYILGTTRGSTAERGYVVYDESRTSQSVTKQLRVLIARAPTSTFAYLQFFAENSIKTSVLNLYKSSMDNSVINTEIDNQTNTETLTTTSTMVSSEPLTIARGGLRGNIAEIIIYDRKLTTTEETDVTNYLNNKWSL